MLAVNLAVVRQSRRALLALGIVLAAACGAASPDVSDTGRQPVEFRSADGTMVRADFHPGVRREAPVVILFH